MLPWCRERPQTTTCCLEWLGSLVPWRLQKNNPGGLADEDESDAKIFPVPVSDSCRVKNAQDLPGPSQSNVRCSVSETKRWSKQKVQTRRRQNLVSAPLGTTTLDNMMKDMSKRAGIELHHTNHCLRAMSVTVPCNHICETRHIKSITGDKSDHAVESYNERPSMKQQQQMSLVLSDLLQGKENEVQQQCRPIREEFPLQEPGKAVLAENNFSVQHPFHNIAIREAFPSIFYCSLNVHNYYSSRWV